MGVTLGVPVGVGLLVGPGVPVGVAVGVAMANESVHAGSAALGVICGTLGATEEVFVNCWLVMKVSAARPIVMIPTKNTYQLFFSIFIFSATDRPLRKLPIRR